MSNKTVRREAVSLATTRDMLEAAQHRAREIGVPMCVSICDGAQNETLFARMDGAPLLSVETARNKATTAVSFGMATHKWWDFIKDDPPLVHGLPNIPGLIIFGGGYPLTVDGSICGGVGVGGGHYSEDMDVAEAALEVFENA